MKPVEQRFAENLKSLRGRLGLTQRELAQRLGYSEKSVSKWETGKAIAPGAILPALADVLEVSIDALFGSNAQPEYFLGIDGGGTKTAFLLAKPTEQELKHKLVYDIRHKISRVGAPHELYLAEDAPAALTHRHRAAILLEPAESEAGNALKALCAARGIPLLAIDAAMADVTTEELRDFYRRSGVHLYSQSDAVIYRDESHLFLHTVEAGTVSLAAEGELYDVMEDKPYPASFPVQCGESHLFRVSGQGDVSRETPM